MMIQINEIDKEKLCDLIEGIAAMIMRMKEYLGAFKEEGEDDSMHYDEYGAGMREQSHHTGKM